MITRSSRTLRGLDCGQSDCAGPEATRVAVIGLGTVGRALLGLMVERSLPIALVAVTDTEGALSGELDPAQVLLAKARGHLPAEVARRDVLKVSSPDVVIDLTSCDFKTAEPALSMILEGFACGAHVVTVNKAPLARFWGEISAAASSADRTLGYSGAAGAALPAVAMARSLARFDDVESFEGILTGTTTFILEEMSKGISLDRAIARAMEEGITEPDPSLDVNGWDTGAKTVILANTLWDEAIGLEGVSVIGLDSLIEVDSEDWPVRLVGAAVRAGDEVHLEVAPKQIAQDHPLSGLQGRDKGVVFHGPHIGHVVVSGGRSHPSGAAASVLGDVLELSAVL